MKKLVFVASMMLATFVGYLTYPAVSGHLETLPPEREQKQSEITISAIPNEVEAYLQFLLVEKRRNRPVGAGVCVDRNTVNIPFIGSRGYCRFLSVAHVCTPIILDPRHEGGNIHGDRFQIIVTDIHPFLDLCTGVALHEFEAEIDVIDLNPERYGQVYNYSAPLGVFEGGELWMLPMFTGHVLGYAGDLRENLLTTVPIDHGSSGSALYQRGALVGLVSQKHILFEHYSYAVRSEFIAQYLHMEEIEFTVRDGPDRIALPPR